VLLSRTQVGRKAFDGTDEIDNRIDACGSATQRLAGKLQPFPDNIGLRNFSAARFGFDSGDQRLRQANGERFHVTKCITSLSGLQYATVVANAASLTRFTFGDGLEAGVGIELDRLS
jgi:hypothetical protein